MKSIQETRRARLRQIIQENFQGSTAALTAALEFASPNFVARLVSESAKNQKPIGTKLARKIEAAAGRDAYFLDTPPQEGAATTLRIGGKEVELEPLESQLVALFKGVSRDSQEALLGRAQALYLAEHPEISRVNPYPIGPATLQETARRMRQSLGMAPKLAKPKVAAARRRTKPVKTTPKGAS